MCVFDGKKDCDLADQTCSGKESSISPLSRQLASRLEEEISSCAIMVVFYQTENHRELCHLRLNSYRLIQYAFLSMSINLMVLVHNDWKQKLMHDMFRLSIWQSVNIDENMRNVMEYFHEY